MKNSLRLLVMIIPFVMGACHHPSGLQVRNIQDFDKNWKFFLGDTASAKDPSFNDSLWRTLDLPHDWSIEGSFNQNNPSGTSGGALPGGIAWYRKSFSLPVTDSNKCVFIDFDGVYRNSEVWINGHYLGIRPYGYSSFRYDLTPYLNFGKTNTIAVRVDNSKQPNSRWYSGSGIYRNVWLTVTGKIFVDHWGTCIVTPEITSQSARVVIKTRIRNTTNRNGKITLATTILDPSGKKVETLSSDVDLPASQECIVTQEAKLTNPTLWSLEKPALYTAHSSVLCDNKAADDYNTSFGIRSFVFDHAKGFSLNGIPVKIKGVCDHHDLGCLGAAINTSAIERQIEILKGMGCNAIRTSHNPPAPELLDLCDRMGMLVMDEAFDMWKKAKTTYDYSLDFDAWHQRDLSDLILRDRNHPCVIIWSIGNEIPEQGDTSGYRIAKELAGIVRSLDATRPITSACNHPTPDNYIIRSGALDLIGYNYYQNLYPSFPDSFPAGKFIATETTSAIATRGSYDMPSDSIRRWGGWGEYIPTNADLSCSAYDNCAVPWGSTHEETWKVIKKYDFLSGQFIWTGFDYLGEPTPYPWPARSSYFGICDLAGFPKDAYYLYESEWTNKPVLHIFPHWNWKQGQKIDVWAYSNAQEVELFLNGKSLGTKEKTGDECHLVWHVTFKPGTLKAIARTNGKEVMTQEIRTAGEPAKILLQADRSKITADGKDLSFVTVSVVDNHGTPVPLADNLVKFEIKGEGKVLAVDNGSPISLESFKASQRKAFHGLCLAVIQSDEKPGVITLSATSEGLQPASLDIKTVRP